MTISVVETTSFKSPQAVLSVLPVGSRYLLESTLSNEQARWAILGCTAARHFKSRGSECWIDDAKYSACPFAKLSELMQESQEKSSDLPDLIFTGGWLGGVRYEAAQHFGMQVAKSEDYDLFFYLVKSFFLFDLLNKKIFCVSSEGKISELLSCFKKAPFSLKVKTPIDFQIQDYASIESNFSQKAYIQAIERIQEHIRDGDTYQVNLSQRFSFENRVTPESIYRALGQLSPVPFAAFLEWEGVTIISGSPERLFSSNGKTIRSRPIAGTRRMGNEEETKRFLSELREDPKECAEHAMLVDLVRNDLGRICSHGSVEVSAYMELVPYRSVIHTESEIQGQLRDGVSFKDIMEALFPGGTITGVPKKRTMEIIHDLEASPRGIYTGSIGYWGFNGHSDFNIMIRPIVCKGSQAYTQAGGGITCQAIPSREYKETLHKARTQIAAIMFANEGI